MSELALLVLAIWIICGVLAFWLFVRFTLREDGEVTLGTAIFLAFMGCFGPAGLIVSIIATISLSTGGVFDKVLWRKKPGPPR